jgi:hypothetical protein
MGGLGIGEPTVEYWAKQENRHVQILCSGGNIDWAMESARINTRAEQTHILVAMIQLLPIELAVFLCS